jgi:hypothetical protein
MPRAGTTCQLIPILDVVVLQEVQVHGGTAEQ